MKKDIHMKTNTAIFVCASCNNKIEVKTTLKDNEIAIDVCDKCHPFYIGSSVSQQVKGRAEKFSKKMTVQQQTNVKKENKSKKQNKKIVDSFNNL